MRSHSLKLTNLQQRSSSNIDRAIFQPFLNSNLERMSLDEYESNFNDSFFDQLVISYREIDKVYKYIK